MGQAEELPQQTGLITDISTAYQKLSEAIAWRKTESTWQAQRTGLQVVRG
jgi:hypothetical protein